MRRFGRDCTNSQRLLQGIKLLRSRPKPINRLALPTEHVNVSLEAVCSVGHRRLCQLQKPIQVFCQLLGPCGQVLPDTNPQSAPSRRGWMVVVPNDREIAEAAILNRPIAIHDVRTRHACWYPAANILALGFSFPARESLDGSLPLPTRIDN